jgi:hypothetical protein
MTLTVGQLRRAIANLPDDMPVITDDGEAPMQDALIYIAPAHHRGTSYRSIGEGHLNPTTDWARKVYGDYENIHVLLISQFGHDDAEDITPPSSPSTIDGEVLPPELPPGGVQ